MLLRGFNADMFGDRSGGPGRPELVSHNGHRSHFHVPRGSSQYSHVEHHLTMASLLCPDDILLDILSHDVQEFMGHVSDWMMEQVSFRSVPVLCMNKRFFETRNA